MAVWKSLTHHGPAFPPPYKRLPKNVNLLYAKRPLRGLSASAEEAASIYANQILRTKHKDAKSKRFNKNFFEDFRLLFSPKMRREVTNWTKLDFKQLVAHFKKHGEKAASLSKKEKQKKKEKNEALKERHGFCRLNGGKEALGIWMIEPPGIFRGREGHPQHGRIKLRIKPQDVTINCSSKKGPSPPEGTKWKAVIQDPEVTWLAKYTNNLGQTKYIQFSQVSKIKTLSDERKYNFAKSLGESIKRIRRTYTKLLSPQKSQKERQMGVAIYFIDEFALRVGNEKGAEEADTVGCSTLRVEHLSLKSRNQVSFDFKGKDSIQFKNQVKVTSKVYNVLRGMINGKRKRDQLFDLLKAPDINSYLKELQPNLTAKVFRTYKASAQFEAELLKKSSKAKSEVNLKAVYTTANLKIAKLCNHKKTVNKEAVQRSELRLKQNIQKRKSRLASLERKIRSKSSRIKNLEEKSLKARSDLKTVEYKLRLHKDGKEFALNTSQQNYLDPRITVAWCKRHKIPVERIWAKTLINKYQWAILRTSGNFRFLN